MGDSRRRPPANPIPEGPVNPSSRSAVLAGDPLGPCPYFLVVDTRFAVPVFVFLDADPAETPGYPGPRARAVTLARLEEGGSVQPNATIGADPLGAGRYAEFASDAHARAAGYAPVEPRYVGPDWASYASVFHPEGDKGARPPADPARRPRGRNGKAGR
jgi:hypothetical protein